MTANPSRSHRLIVPEVVQTSAMDCGPAALKCLLEGFGISVGYGRLRAAGCVQVFAEVFNGSEKKRPQLTACLAQLQAGDTLVITRIDRLARSTLDLCLIVAELEARGVHFQVTEQASDTSTAVGQLHFHVLAAIAEFEKKLHKERQREGIAQAKARGLYTGRKPSLSRAQRRALVAQRAIGVPIKELMRTFQLSKASVYRYLAAAEPTAEAEGCAEPGVAYDVPAAAD